MKGINEVPKVAIIVCAKTEQACRELGHCLTKINLIFTLAFTFGEKSRNNYSTMWSPNSFG
jgi:hypothetical protein